MPKSTTGKSLVLTALIIGLTGIGGTGGTGYAAPLQSTNVVGHPGATGRCASLPGADRAACRTLAAIVADANRNAALGALSKDWQGPRLAAFARLVAAERAFAQAFAANETGVASDAAGAEQAQNDAFVATLQRLVAGRLSPGVDSFAATDESLNDAYGRVMNVDNTDELGWGDVRKAGILRTERAWIVYRDAFVGFAATLDAPEAADCIKSELTRQRTASLDSFLGD